MAQSIPSVPTPPPPTPGGICHLVLEKLQMPPRWGRAFIQIPAVGIKKIGIFLSEILKKPLLEELTHSPGRGFQTNSLPLGPTR